MRDGCRKVPRPLVARRRRPAAAAACYRSNLPQSPTLFAGTCSKCGQHAFHFECTAEYVEKVSVHRLAVPAAHPHSLLAWARTPRRPSPVADPLDPLPRVHPALVHQMAKHANSSSKATEKGKNIARNRPQVGGVAGLRLGAALPAAGSGAPA